MVLPIRSDSHALPLPFGLSYMALEDNPGDSWIAAVDFGETANARVLLSYGNASQLGSPHHGDQLPLLMKGELRPAWRIRSEIEANLESREVVEPARQRDLGLVTADVVG